MKSILLISYLYILFCVNILGQSLISGGDFETPTSIPNNYGQIALQPNCIAAYGTPDLFNRSSQVFGVSNPLGEQIPLFGDGYAGILASSFERIAFRLNDKLVKDEKYLLSFYISTAEKSQCIRVPIVGRLAYNPKEYMTKQTPHVRYDSIEPLKNMENWVYISDTVIAQGGEEYVIIGFENLSRFGHNCITYYYLDEVTLMGSNPVPSIAKRELKTDYMSIFYSSNITTMSHKDSIQMREWISTISVKEITKINVFGSADSQGGYESNSNIALRRARFVAEFLNTILDKGVDIGIASQASDDKNVESRDRRVDIIIEYLEDLEP